jgi:hypothetical protein
MFILHIGKAAGKKIPGVKAQGWRRRLQGWKPNIKLPEGT